MPDLNTVPEGWSLDRLVNRVVSKVLGTTVRGTGEENVILIKMGNLSGGKINYKKTELIGSSEELESLRLQYGDFLFNTRNTPDLVGKVANFRDKNVKAVFDNNLLRLVFQSDVDSIYMGYLFNLDSTVVQLKQIVAGTTSVAAIYWNDLSRLQQILPPLPEQQKIAAILSSVDGVIEKTQAQIDKLKDLKTGMMQELLSPREGSRPSKVMGHTEFRDSPVGRIPVGWDVASLGELASFVTSGSRGWAQYYSDSGAIFIRIGNLTREHINFRFNDIVYVTPPNTAEGKRTLVQKGDVLISITADLGVIAVVNDQVGEAYVNQHVSLVRLDDPDLARWVGHYLAFEDTQKQFTANNDAGAKAGLNLTAIRKTLVAIPSDMERESIVNSLDSVDDLISKRRESLQQNNNIKKALMQDLLTGTVRVKVG